MAINAPRGTQDILPKDSSRWQFVEKTLLDSARLFGFSEIRTPVFESIDLFQRGVGDTTDVVQKEMYEVKAQKSDERYALRPEGTAGVVRAAIEKGLLNEALPLKVSYIISCFRHERPQLGRYREFHQFGCEVFGSASPLADVEMISLIDHVIKLLGLSNIKLNINSIGCPTCKKKYYEKLREYFEAYTDKLCATCITRLEKNPMRILDCKSPECGKIAEGAPIMIDFLCEECDAHFNAVKSGLGKLSIEYKINPKVVRGLDYYTKTVFEFISENIGAQGTVFGGGRYDGLVEMLGGKPTPALGFAMGIERLLLTLEAQGIKLPEPPSCDIYIGSMGELAGQKALELVTALRNEGFTAECDLMGRSVKAQMKYANKLPTTLSMVLGESELESGKAGVKDMASGEEREIDFNKDLVSVLYDLMLAREADAIANSVGGDAFSRIMQMR